MRGCVSRRALLGAGLAPALPAAAQDSQGSDPRARFTALSLGANLERWFPVAADQRPRRLGHGWWHGLRAQGFDLSKLQKAGGGSLP